MRTVKTLTLAEANLILDAAQAKSEELGIAHVLCVADNAGYTIALRRMDGGKVTSVQIAENEKGGSKRISLETRAGSRIFHAVVTSQIIWSGFRALFETPGSSVKFSRNCPVMSVAASRGS